jgi:hypothetical protein
MALPKPLSERDTGMPQMKRRSAVRTAAGSVQEAFLTRVRAVRDDPLLILPDVVGEEPRAIARLRSTLEGIRAGKLGFLARRGKGLVGAVWACRELAEREAAPRLMDARIEGDRRFFLPVGHIGKPALLGVQNWDDPFALMLAYEDLAEGGLHFFAGPDLWCTGRRAALVPEWVDAFGSRIGASLVIDGSVARCPHSDRATLSHLLDGAEIRLCESCCRPETAPTLASRLKNPGGRRPYGLEVVLPDGTRSEVPRGTDARYRVGQATGAEIVGAALADWHASLGAGRFAIADRLFASQDAFLDAVEAPAWMRPALAAMTKAGHAAPSLSLADLLARHRDRLADGIRALGADPAAVAAKAAGADEGTLLRLAHEQAERAAKTADLPDPRARGPIGQWIDSFVRLRRLEGEATAVARVRREASLLQGKAHVAAFLAACGADPSIGTGFSRDQVEAGHHLAPLAKRVLAETGLAYVEALRVYLAQSGSGESVA